MALEKGRALREQEDWPERQAVYNQTMYERRLSLRDQLQAVKQATGCLFCDETEPYCLDLHHVHPTDKKFVVSAGLSSRSFHSLIAEAAKCVVLCANCHRKVHYGLLVLPPDAPRFRLEMP